jgi:hypothetical protein
MTFNLCLGRIVNDVRHDEVVLSAPRVLSEFGRAAYQFGVVVH